MKEDEEGCMKERLKEDGQVEKWKEEKEKMW